MVVRPSPGRPPEQPVGLLDGQVVDAGVAVMHESVGVELPVLVAVGAVPLPGVVVAFVGESYGDAVVGDGPKFLDQPVVEFAVPLAGQERDDLVAALDEFRAVPPVAVDGVSQRDLRGVAGIPAVLGQPDLLDRGFTGERRYGWTGCHHLILLHTSQPPKGLITSRLRRAWAAAPKPTTPLACRCDATRTAWCPAHAAADDLIGRDTARRCVFDGSTGGAARRPVAVDGPQHPCRLLQRRPARG